jgi:glycosyltransferase involved in cell wall biosynthesis
MSPKAIPRVSVIVPNYNHARFLKQRLDSVLGQTYQDFELLILDDASTDNSREIIEGYRSHPKVVHIEYNQINSGTPFKQWNKGMRLARGQYVWIAEADDYADKNFLQTLVPDLERHVSAGLAYCSSWIVDERSHVLSLNDPYMHSLERERWRANFVNNGKDECRRYLIFENTIPNASAVLFQRDLVERMGFADESFKLNGDWMFWAKMLALSDVVFSAEPLNYWRHHRNTVRLNTTITVYLEEARKVLDFIKDEMGVRKGTLRKARFYMHLDGARAFNKQKNYWEVRRHMMLALLSSPVEFSESCEIRQLIREQLHFYFGEKGTDLLKRKYYRKRIWAGAQRRKLWKAVKALVRDDKSAR